MHHREPPRPRQRGARGNATHGGAPTRSTNCVPPRKLCPERPNIPHGWAQMLPKWVQTSPDLSPFTIEEKLAVPAEVAAPIRSIGFQRMISAPEKFEKYFLEFVQVRTNCPYMGIGRFSQRAKGMYTPMSGGPKRVTQCIRVVIDAGRFRDAFQSNQWRRTRRRCCGRRSLHNSSGRAARLGKFRSVQVRVLFDPAKALLLTR
jgi:hypothetical protein